MKKNQMPQIGLPADACERSGFTEKDTLELHAKGSYVLKAEFTDDGGRTYRYEQGFKVYPVPAVSYSLPEYVHTDTDIAVKTETTDLDGLTVEWLVDNTYGFQDWPTYVDGTLTNGGGTIRFKRAGVYELAARVTDETGRVFLYESHGGRQRPAPCKRRSEIRKLSFQSAPIAPGFQMGCGEAVQGCREREAPAGRGADRTGAGLRSLYPDPLAGAGGTVPCRESAGGFVLKGQPSV